MPHCEFFFPRAKKKELRFVLKTQSEGERRTSRRSEYSLVRHKRLPTPIPSIPFSSSLPVGFPARPLKGRGRRNSFAKEKGNLGLFGQLRNSMPAMLRMNIVRIPILFLLLRLHRSFFSFLNSICWQWQQNPFTEQNPRFRNCWPNFLAASSLPILADKQTSSPRTNGLNWIEGKGKEGWKGAKTNSQFHEKRFAFDTKTYIKVFFQVLPHHLPFPATTTAGHWQILLPPSLPFQRWPPPTSSPSSTAPLDPSWRPPSQGGGGRRPPRRPSWPPPRWYLRALYVSYEENCDCTTRSFQYPDRFSNKEKKDKLVQFLARRENVVCVRYCTRKKKK